MDLFSIPTPFVAVDRLKLQANIAAMQALADRSGVRLRPHAKTHKSAVVAHWQVDSGAVGICCAKLGEAEVLADAGVADIRLPYPVQPANATRVLALMDRAKLSIVVDDAEVAEAWSREMTEAGRRLDVLVKVDVGFHRCGVNPESPQVIDVIRRIGDLPGVRLLGLLSHAGQGYGAVSAAELETIAVRESDILNGLAAELRARGAEVMEVSVGSTPTARFIGRQPGVTEMRPGNYVFFDRTQVGLEAAPIDHCALTVVSTVVSRPARDRLILDAGSKTLSSDGARGFGGPVGFGLVFPSLDALAPDETIVPERLSEEHATTRVSPECTLRPGDRVRIVPNHSCVVTNLANDLLLTEGTAVIERIPVTARGKNY